jgi:hypothetical protein
VDGKWTANGCKVPQGTRLLSTKEKNKYMYTNERHRWNKIHVFLPLLSVKDVTTMSRVEKRFHQDEAAFRHPKHDNMRFI